MPVYFPSLDKIRETADPETIYICLCFAVSSNTYIEKLQASESLINNFKKTKLRI